MSSSRCQCVEFNMSGDWFMFECQYVVGNLLSCELREKSLFGVGRNKLQQQREGVKLLIHAGRLVI